MNNSVVGFLWWKTKSLAGLSLKDLQDAFLIPYGEHEVLRSPYVAPRSPPLMFYHQNKVSRIYAD